MLKLFGFSEQLDAIVDNFQTFFHKGLSDDSDYTSDIGSVNHHNANAKCLPAETSLQATTAANKRSRQLPPAPLVKPAAQSSDSTSKINTNYPSDEDTPPHRTDKSLTSRQGNTNSLPRTAHPLATSRIQPLIRPAKKSLINVNSQDYYLSSNQPLCEKSRKASCQNEDSLYFQNQLPAEFRKSQPRQQRHSESYNFDSDATGEFLTTNRHSAKPSSHVAAEPRCDDNVGSNADLFYNSRPSSANSQQNSHHANRVNSIKQIDSAQINATSSGYKLDIDSISNDKKPKDIVARKENSSAKSKLARERWKMAIASIKKNGKNVSSSFILVFKCVIRQNFVEIIQINLCNVCMKVKGEFRIGAFNLS